MDNQNVGNGMNFRSNDGLVPRWQSAGILVIAIALVASAIGATVLHGWWQENIWGGGGLSQLLFYRFVAWAMLAFMLLLALRVPFILIVSVVLILDVGLAGAGPLTSVAWFWICAMLAGAWIIALSGSERGPVWTVRNSVVGFAAIGSLIGVLAHYPVCTPTIFFALISFLAVFCGWRLHARGRFREKLPIPLLWKKRKWPEIIMLALVLLGGTLVLMVGLLPDVGYDALAVHLNVPARMLETGLWRFDVTEYIWAVMPLGADWLLVPPYFLAGEAGARLMSISFLLATAWLTYQILLPRIGSLCALAAPALLLTLPLTFLVSATTFVEPALALFFVCCFSELSGSDNSPIGSWLVMGVIAGYACSIKLLGAPLLPILLIGVLIRSRTGHFEKPTLRVVVVALVFFLLCSLPPYIVALFKTGNPFFPFYNQIFRSPFFTTESVFGNGQGFSNPLYSKTLSWRLLWDASVNSKAFGESVANGAVGIVFLVMVPLSLLIGAVRRRWWLVAVVLGSMAYIAVVFHSQAYLRYVYQIVPWLLIAASWAFSKFAIPRLSVVLVVAILCAVNLLRFPVTFWPLQQFDPMLFISRASNQAFFSANKPIAVVGDILEKMDDMRDQQILIIGADPAFSHFPSGTLADSWHSSRYFYSEIKYTEFTKLVGQLGVDVIVHSIDQGEPHEAEIMQITDEVLRIHSIRIGRIKPELMYTHEKVVGPNLSQLDPAWVIGKASIREGGVEATVAAPITQSIDFSGRPKGLLEMRVACAEGHLFRSQINWYDAKGVFLSPDIQVHACNPKGITIKRVVKRPEGATSGTIFGGSADETPVMLQWISLRTFS
ncbi:glycosyltransferase family 39 protein [Herbaspirillum sp. RTI4]|uniref:glycosyltransferase family 39 protein n=1 Tax=Herbaspirillum sp. RTI4 TaxID=3048640 RepID=UPI002AB52B68|nr:glycosyltransferase family 39 protein [Herbaspirillum sp. RTI4]MDY7577615.1 glycosyltransferase family 39 protein [Herbaspirillum sp. RTI4]MEA9983286.1 glycosyltransferase family 39 protein [Herbaspirillum sp. RTI4]